MQFTLKNIWEYSLEICNKDTFVGTKIFLLHIQTIMLIKWIKIYGSCNRTWSPGFYFSVFTPSEFVVSG